jgi:hypothetical protein
MEDFSAVGLDQLLNASGSETWVERRTTSFVPVRTFGGTIELRTLSAAEEKAAAYQRRFDSLMARMRETDLKFDWLC